MIISSRRFPHEWTSKSHDDSNAQGDVVLQAHASQISQDYSDSLHSCSKGVGRERRRWGGRESRCAVKWYFNFTGNGILDSSSYFITAHTDLVN